jgi:hypothetical protein
MENNSVRGKGVTHTQDSVSRWVQWATLRPTQGAIGYIQVEEKKNSYRELEPEKRRSFAEEQAITVVLGPSAVLDVIDHHHWARAWFDMGFLEAPIRIREDFSGLTDEQLSAPGRNGAGCTLSMSTAGNSMFPTCLARLSQFPTTFSKASPLSFESRACAKTPENSMQSSHGRIFSGSESPPGPRPSRVLR